MTSISRVFAAAAAALALTAAPHVALAPFAMPKSSQPFPNGNVTVYDTSLGWRFPNPRLEAMFPLEAMGETAENLVEKYGIARAAQDAFALASHEKAASAQAAGRFDPGSVPVRPHPPPRVDPLRIPSFAQGAIPGRARALQSSRECCPSVGNIERPRGRRKQRNEVRTSRKTALGDT